MGEWYQPLYHPPSGAAGGGGGGTYSPQRSAIPRRHSATLPRPSQSPQLGGAAASQGSGGWGDLTPSNAIVDSNGFPRVNLGVMYDTAKRGLTEETYNNAADAGFGSLRAGPYVASLNQNIGNLQGQMAGKAADLAEAEAGRRLSQIMQREQISSAEKMLGMELGSREHLQTAALAAEKERLGMQLSTQERLALATLTEQGRQFDIGIGEQGRQYDLGLGQRASEYGADLAYKLQLAEDQRYQNYLAWLYGGATRMTEPTGRVVPNAIATQSSNPFAQLLGPVLGAAAFGMGMRG